MRLDKAGLGKRIQQVVISLCFSISPSLPSAVFLCRLGAAERALTRYAAAIETYKKGLKIDPENKEFKTFITECEELKVKQAEEKKRQAKLKAEAEEKEKQQIMVNSNNGVLFGC